MNQLSDQDYKVAKRVFVVVIVSSVMLSIAATSLFFHPFLFPWYIFSVFVSYDPSSNLGVIAHFFFITAISTATVGLFPILKGRLLLKAAWKSLIFPNSEVNSSQIDSNRRNFTNSPSGLQILNKDFPVLNPYKFFKLVMFSFIFFVFMYYVIQFSFSAVLIRHSFDVYYHSSATGIVVIASVVLCCTSSIVAILLSNKIVKSVLGKFFPTTAPILAKISLGAFLIGYGAAPGYALVPAGIVEAVMYGLFS